MRDYPIHAFDSDGDVVVSLGQTVKASNSAAAIDRADALSQMYPKFRFVVSNDEGRNLYAFEDGEEEYLGH